MTVEVTQSYYVKSHLSKDVNEPCCMGIDEAGRGPVLGPMVYSVCYCPVSKKEDLANLGFADSKTLSEEDRERLFQVIEEKKYYIGWCLHAAMPQTISRGMLGKAKYNLNAQAHDITISLIKDTLEAGINLQEIYIDTVGPPEKYQAKLEELFPGIEIVVAKKADSLYPVVSAASICAKVHRDRVLKEWRFREMNLQQRLDSDFGSGYPSDPATKQWLVKAIDPVFGFPDLIRFSWSTCSRILEDKCVPVKWPNEEELNIKRTKNSFFTPVSKKEISFYEKFSIKVSTCF